MKIAIISDTHGNVANFKNVVGWLNKENIKLILHCGDIGSPESLRESLEDFDGEFQGVLGNMDKDYRIELDKYREPPKIKVSETIGEIGINKKKIAFTHYLETAENLAKTGKYDFVFYGHTHKPWLEKTGIFSRRPKPDGRGECWLVNPGNIAGTFYKATFVVYNSEKDKLELKILEKLE